MTQLSLTLPILITLTGCASLQAPNAGLLYSDTQYEHSATGNPSGNRIGEACSTNLLGLVAVGDSSIETARRNGGITTISSVDESSSNYFILYGKHCTQVRGR